jgi:hypothetical protein
LTAAAGLAASACASPIAGLLGEEAATAVEPEPALEEDATSGEVGATAQADGSVEASALAGSPAAEQLTEPMVAASLPLPGLAVQVAYREPHVFVAGQNGGLHIVEVVRDEQPVHVGTLDGAADFVTLHGDLLLALDVGAESPLRAWNIATPQLPVEIRVEPGIWAEKFSSVALEGPLAVVSGGTAPMSVLDTSDPSRITIHAQVDKPFGYAAARLRGGRAFVSTEVGGDGRFGVVIYDLEDPRNPRLLGSVRVPNGAGLSRVRSAAHFDVSVDLIDDIMFATGDGAIYAVDISKIAEPREIGLFPAPSDVVWVERSADRLVVAGLDVAVIDATRPSRPTPLFQIATPGQARSAVMERDRIYVADGDAGLTIVKLPPTPSEPVRR